MSSVSAKVKHGIKWQFIANILGQAIYFINGVILARILNPRDFGIYGMTQLLAGFVFMFWNLGLNAALIQKKDISDAHIHTAFTICMAMGLLCSIIVWFAAPFIAAFFKEPLVVPLTRLIGITFLIYALDRVPSALLNRNMYFKQVSIVDVINPLLYGLVTIPLAISGFGPFSFVWGIIAGAAGMMVYRIYLGVKIFNLKPRFLFHKEAANHLLGFGVFITMTNIVNYFLWQFQNIITGRFFGAIDLGYFTKSSNLSVMPLKNVQSNVWAVLLPAFSNIQHDKEKIRDWFRKFNFFTYAFVAPPLIFFIFFPNEVMVGLFGNKWSASAPLLMWLSLSALLGINSMYFINILQAVGKPRLDLTISLFRLIPFITLILLATKFGLKGIAIALFINSIIGIVCYIVVLGFYRILSFRDIIISSLEPIAISIVFCGLTYLLKILIITKITSVEIALLSSCIIFALFLLPYCAYRWFRNSYIGYLGFDIREIVRLQ